MLDCKPQYYIKFWKLSTDEDGERTIEIMAHDTTLYTIGDYSALVWRMIDGITSVSEIIDIVADVYVDNTREEIKEAVCDTLKELEEKNLIILNWNPFG